MLIGVAVASRVDVLCRRHGCALCLRVLLCCIARIISNRIRHTHTHSLSRFVRPPLVRSGIVDLGSLNALALASRHARQLRLVRRFALRKRNYTCNHIHNHAPTYRANVGAARTQEMAAQARVHLQTGRHAAADDHQQQPPPPSVRLRERSRHHEQTAGISECLKVCLTFRVDCHSAARQRPPDLTKRSVRLDRSTNGMFVHVSIGHF
jgi:hypothetical protein